MRCADIAAPLAAALSHHGDQPETRVSARSSEAPCCARRVHQAGHSRPTEAPEAGSSGGASAFAAAQLPDPVGNLQILARRHGENLDLAKEAQRVHRRLADLRCTPTPPVKTTTSTPPIAVAMLGNVEG